MSVGISMAFGSTFGQIIFAIFKSESYVMISLSIVYLLLLLKLIDYLPEDKDKPKKSISFQPYVSNFQFMTVFMCAALSIGVQTFIFCGLVYEMNNFRTQETFIINESTILAIYTMLYAISCLFMTTKYA